MSGYRFYLFGAPRLEYQDQPVEIDTRKALALLAYLLIEKQPQSRDTLATLLWPESDQTSARAALRRTLSPLRNALSDDLIDFGREMLTVYPDTGLWCDVIAFRERLADCQTHGHGKNEVCPYCQTALKDAARLYTADFMAGFSLRDSAEFDDWQFFEAERLRRELASVLERLVILLQEQGEFSAAIEYARRWLGLDPLNEAAHRALITLYTFDDQRSAALRQYRECVRILDEELGVPPLNETTSLYEAVKENRLEKSAGDEGISVIHDRAPLDPDRQFNGQQTPISDFVPLIGRKTEWAQMTQLYESVQEDGVVIVLTGEAGIGKTHLAHEFIDHMSSRGGVVLTARGYVGENCLAYAPLIDLLRQGIRKAEGQMWWMDMTPHWLGEVALLIPELSGLIPDLVISQPSEGPGAQSRFYEGVCKVLEALVKGQSPGLILIDNLEWVDESTLDILVYLMRRLQGRPICLLVAWQTEPSPALARLDEILIEALRQGYGHHIPLKALSQHQAQELIQSYKSVDRLLPQEFIERLVDESGGFPYFLVEYLQAILEGKFPTVDANEPWPVPLGLRGMLQTRLESLSETATQILQAAAVIGRTFNSDLLEAASGRTEDEIIQGIEELLALNLIREVSIQAKPNRAVAIFDFKHDTVRALVLEEISLVRTRLLHRRTAEALVEQARLIPELSLDGQIAYHYQKAGMPEQAAERYFKAGQATRSVHANADALVYFQTALSLGHPKKQKVLVEIGDLCALKGDYVQAIQYYETAAAIKNPDLLPSIEQKIGQVYLRRGYWEQAACHFEAALYDLRVFGLDQQKAFEARVRADWSLACHRSQQNEKANILAQEALALAESAQDPLSLAQTYNLLGILARADQKPGLATTYLKESLGLTKDLENPVIQIGALNNLSLAQADQGEYQQAIDTIKSALKECILIGDRHLEAAIRNNYADLLRTSGEPEAAMTELKQAISIFSDIGQQAEDWEPEIWKLVTW